MRKIGETSVIMRKTQGIIGDHEKSYKNSVTIKYIH